MSHWHTDTVAHTGWLISSKETIRLLLQVNIVKAQPVLVQHWSTTFTTVTISCAIGTRAQSSPPLSVSPNSRQRRCWLQEQQMAARISWPSTVSFFTKLGMWWSDRFWYLEFYRDTKARLPYRFWWHSVPGKQQYSTERKFSSSCWSFGRVLSQQ